MATYNEITSVKTCTVNGNAGTTTLSDVYVANISNTGNLAGNVNKATIEYDSTSLNSWLTGISFTNVDDTVKSIKVTCTLNKTGAVRTLAIKLKNQNNSNLYIIISQAPSIGTLDPTPITTEYKFQIFGVSITRIVLTNSNAAGIITELPSDATVLSVFSNGSNLEATYNASDGYLHVNTFHGGTFGDELLNDGDTFYVYGYQTSTGWILSSLSYTYKKIQMTYILTFNYTT